VAERLYRSRDDRMLAGVAGGLAAVMDVDPSIIRVVWVLITFLSGGIALLVYIVMAVVVPEAPDGWDAAQRTRSVTTSPTGPVPPGSWVGPDGALVPYAGTAPSAAGSTGAPGATALAATAGPTAEGWNAPRPSGDGKRAGVVIGTILILVGGAFLVREFLPAVDLSLVWPVAAIGFGIMLLILAVRPRRTSG
jgi:phage shock protein C